MSRWPRLMKRETLAEYLDRSTDYVDELRRAGSIAFFPGTKLFDRKVIDKWLDDGSGLSNPESASRWQGRMRDGGHAA